MSAGKVPPNLREHAPMTAAKKWLDTKEIELVECLVPDINGVSKGKIVRAEDLVSGEIRLPEAVFGQDVVGGWCEDHDLFDVADQMRQHWCYSPGRILKLRNVFAIARVSTVNHWRSHQERY